MPRRRAPLRLSEKLRAHGRAFAALIEYARIRSGLAACQWRMYAARLAFVALTGQGT